MKFWKFILEIISLQSARARLVFAATAHILLLIVPYAWLSNLSLYKFLGLTEAPSIGLTRAYWKLLHGDLAGAWERNWLIFPVLAVGWSLVALDIYSFFRKSKPSESLRPQDQ